MAALNDRPRYRPEMMYAEGSTTGRVHIGILGPNDGVHFAGNFTPDELEAFGVSLIATATKARLGLPLE